MTPRRPRPRNGPHWTPHSWFGMRSTTERLQQARRDREVTPPVSMGFRDEGES